MNQSIAFIWDLDGTLLDSYPAILAGIEEAYEVFDIPFEKEAITDYILRYSVRDLLKEVAEKAGVDFEELSQVRAKSLREKNAQVQLMTGAREVLEWTKEVGIKNFIYTHKGNNTFALLKELDLDHYFTEVLTADSGFARKPNPEAIFYLMEKYNLDKTSSYYIGDRLLDVQAAQAAGIHSINLMIDKEKDNQKIENLLEIKNLNLL